MSLVAYKVAKWVFLTTDDQQKTHGCRPYTREIPDNSHDAAKYYFLRSASFQRVNECRCVRAQVPALDAGN